MRRGLAGVAAIFLAVVEPGPAATGSALEPGALTLTVTVKQSSWPAGGVLELGATLKNTGATPLLIDIFGDLNELYTWKRKSTDITSCWMLSWEGSNRPPGRRMGRAPLFPSQFLVLEPGRTYTKRLAMTLEAVAPGSYRFRLAYTPRVSCPTFSIPQNWLTEHSLPTTTPVWDRMLFSNDLTIEIRERS